MLLLDLFARVNEVTALVAMVIDFQDVGTVVFPFRPLLPLHSDGPPLVVVPPKALGPCPAVRIPAPEGVVLLFPFELGSCCFSFIISLGVSEACCSYSGFRRSVSGSATSSIVERLISSSQGINKCCLAGCT